MQHTEFYQLNKIEKDDAFSPDPLNENAESVETADYLTGVAVRAEAYARDAVDTALDQRITQLEAGQVLIGTYTGNQSEDNHTQQMIHLGFTPGAIILFMGLMTPNAIKLTRYSQAKRKKALDKKEKMCGKALKTGLLTK